MAFRQLCKEIVMTTPPDLSEFSLDEICSALDDVRHSFEIAVYGSENYYNFGAIVRVAHNFLCRKIWMVDFSDFYKKASMGSHKYENVQVVTLTEFLTVHVGRNIVAFERRPDLDSKDIRDFRYPKDPILFFGSEKFGVPDRVLEQAHSAVSIPVFGVHNDYNQAVAAGIVMYDFVVKLNRYG